jgi:hypothetical protein
MSPMAVAVVDEDSRDVCLSYRVVKRTFAARSLWP